MKLLSDKKNILVCLLLIVVIFIVYGNALFNSFVVDDGYLIINNDIIKNLSNLKRVILSDVTIATPIGRASGYYRPISMVFLMFSYKLWWPHAFGFHLGSILLHMANTILVFFLLKAISRNVRVALLAAILFAIHPIHVDAVTPIYNYMGLLASFFCLASFLAFVRSLETAKIELKILSVVLFFFGLFSKEEALVLPLVLALYDYYFYANFHFRQIVRRWRFYLAFFLVGCFYLSCRFLILDKETVLGLWGFKVPFNIAFTESKLHNFLMVVKIYYEYIFLLFFPTDLSVYHYIKPVLSLFSLNTLFLMITVLGSIILSWLFRKIYPLVSFFIMTFFLSSLLISNIFPIGSLFAERFMYFPSLSFCFLFAFVIDGIINKLQRSSFQRMQKILVLFFLIVCFFYGTQTMIRNYVWRNDISLWKDTANRRPQYQYPRMSLADAYLKSNLYDKALLEYEKALQIPSSNEAYIRNEMGKILGQMNHYDKALTEFKKAVALNNRAAEGYYNVGITYFHMNDLAKAESYFQKAMALDPLYPWSYYGLGLVYEKSGQKRKAFEMFSQAIHLEPNFKVAQEALKRIGDDES